MRQRLVLVAAATTLMVTLAFVVPLGLLVRTLAAERALTAARQVAGALAPTIATGDAEDIDVALAIVRPDAPGPVTVVLPDGSVIGDVVVSADEVTRAVAGEAFTEEVAGARDVVTPVFGATGSAVVHVRVPTAVLTAGVWRAWGVLGALALVLVVAAVLVADRLARAVVGPAREVATAARRLAAGERTARAPVGGPPEIADVAAALNGLADRIDEMLAGEREAAADLSHRLRTPMTALRLDVESLPPGDAADRLGADLRALEETVDRLIRQARAGRSTGGVADLAALVRDRLAFWSPLVEDEGRQLEAAVPDEAAWVGAEPDELEAAVDALVGNVLHHTEAGTALAVEVEVDDDHRVLRVHDAGPGFADPSLAERGRSGGTSTGLGLDICRQVAERAGGSFSIGRGRLGGACVELRLPAASPR